MQVWLFNIMMWPDPGERTLYPFPGRLFDPERGRAVYQDHLRLLIRADELGYDALCFTEHHYGTNGLCPSPNVMAAAVATRTSHAKLALMGNCLPIHGHPVPLAEEIALLDVLSNGRVVAGFLRGGFLEYYAYNVDLEESRGRFEEAWELILKAWTADELFAWYGQYYQYDAVSILPRPVQRPHPPPSAGEMTFERFQREGYCIVGEPDYVIAEMWRQQQALGVGTFVTYIPFGTLPAPLALKSVELFAREVLPHVRSERAPVAFGTDV